MRRWRKWLEPTGDADSYVIVLSDPDEDEYATITLRIADCDRRIGLYFWKSNILRGRRKLAVLRDALNEVERRMNGWEK